MKNILINKIIEFIPKGSKVLDLGCGNGELLHRLSKEKGIKGYGVEIDLNEIVESTKKGIPVFHGNIDEGLPEFATNSYDVVILSQTLQQVKKPLFVISEMLRIGKLGIVTFPNFAYWQVRTNLFFKGTSPKTPTLPYDWFNTPNIRVLSIKDFRRLCNKENIGIAKEIPIYETKLFAGILPICFSNLCSKKGMFVIGSDLQ
jgi:methionine biosynthesis protein MetW